MFFNSAYLGFMKFLREKIAAKIMQTEPTIRYVIPKKLFFPPNQEVVERITYFFPLNRPTLKSKRIRRIIFGKLL